LVCPSFVCHLKIQLGIHINDTTRTPIPAPTTVPQLTIVSGFAGELQPIANCPHEKRAPRASFVA